MLRLSRLSVYSLLLLVCYLIIRSCNAEQKTHHTPPSSFVARVGQQYLYASDLESLDILSTEPAGRASLINHYAIEWACKQLLIAQYNKEHPSILPSIEGKIDDYKNDLLAHHFLEELVKREFNEEVSQEELTDYYQKYKHNDFILNHDIVQGVFLAIPKRAAGISSVKSLMLSTRPEDHTKLKVYCKRYAKTSILETDRWFPWETVLAKVGYRPLGHQTSTRLLQSNKFIHVADQKYVYLLRIDQYKMAQEVAPLDDVVRQRIRTIILHKRKLTLIHKIKNNLLQNAKKNHTCVIHVN